MERSTARDGPLISQGFESPSVQVSAREGLFFRAGRGAADVKSSNQHGR